MDVRMWWQESSWENSHSFFCCRYFAVDLIGRQRAPNARLLLVREVKQDESMLCRAGVALVQDGRIVARALEKMCLLPDSGAEENEISYEVAQQLGLLNENVPKQKGPTIGVSSGTYETYRITLKFQINGLDVQGFNKRFRLFHYPDVVHDLSFLFPVQPGNRNNWDILIGKKSSSDMGIVLEFV
jgi:hypothetical protein